MTYKEKDTPVFIKEEQRDVPSILIQLHWNVT